MTEAKATARHKKMAESKVQRLEELKHKISVEEASYKKKKEEGKAKIKALAKEERSGAKEILDNDLNDMKLAIAKLKDELKSLKAEIKADKAKAKSEDSE